MDDKEHEPKPKVDFAYLRGLKSVPGNVFYEPKVTEIPKPPMDSDMYDDFIDEFEHPNVVDLNANVFNITPNDTAA